MVAEALDRVSRDQADVAILYRHLRFAGVPVVTPAEGEINELHVGVKGTMNALFLKDLAAKTHQGIRGLVAAGKAGGGRSYGYGVVKAPGADGERTRGERTINEGQAEVVRRIFQEYAAGMSPHAIARGPNAEDVPGPTGKRWSDSTVRGHANANAGTGMLDNPLCIGRLVWNRHRGMTDPETGKRVTRLNPPEEWIAVEVPALRIVDDALWQVAKDRQAEQAERYAAVIAEVRAAKVNRLNAAHRPRHLLSGLLECAVCEGPYAMRGQDHYSCTGHVTGGCTNRRGIRRTVLEDRVLTRLRDRLTAAEEAMRAYAEVTNRLNRERRASGASDRRELAARREEDRVDDRGHRGRRLCAGHVGPVAGAGGAPGQADRPSRRRPGRPAGHPFQRRGGLPAQGRAAWRGAEAPRRARRGGGRHPGAD